MIEWIKHNWALVTTLLAVGTAYGQQQAKIQTLEDAVKQNAVVQQEIKDIKIQSAVYDERTKSIIESQQRQERMIEMMLINQERYMTKEKSK
jgi:hypothetical protein